MYRLMIVDDSMIIRNRISRTTEEQFSVVCMAKNGKEAIDLCKKYQPDIVTIDLTMPEMDGIETIPKLLEVHPSVQILVVSALNDEATGLEALELGASGFLTKPFTENGLLKALNEIVEFIEEED
ncbi:response regulator transcription factor [Suttonella ornithocola]|uniref:Chemotaxis protein CheY n=1 Tax=Suttonella ornithocola TaxID=279832 RepID=A0A380MR62_9GAMM|nr:response regulator [Suttonella ornithocola]SUO95090.1 Chemotaxis protein CheY [Suttonella ornithocola]